MKKKAESQKNEPPSTNRKTESVPKRIEAVFIPTMGSEEELVEAAFVAAMDDPTPEGRIILDITSRKLNSVTQANDNLESNIIVERVQSRNMFAQHCKSHGLGVSAVFLQKFLGKA